MKLDFRQRLLGTTLLVGANLLATPALAQDVPPPTEGSPTDVTQPSGPPEGQPTPATSATGEPVKESQDIIVTGSRIPQPNLESAAPVTVVSNQDIKLSGTTRIEDLLNSLPSVGASQASGVSNGASGTAEVDLRYLGSKRTLTLVNGRRLAPGDPNSTSQAADLNLIPSAIVKRVEVLTGGASSVYGADAVAGVVNFIMDTNFSGIRFDGQYGVYQHENDDPSVGNGKHMSDILLARQALGLQGYGFPTGSVADGGSFDGTVSIGAGFDDNRGHVVAYFGYRKVRPVLQGRRDYSACVLQNTGGGLPRCGGSATSDVGNVILFNGGTSTIFSFGPGGAFNNTTTLYNFAPLNYYQRPDERYIAGAFANYEISDLIKPYLEFMFMDDHTLAQIAPSGDFGNTLTVNCDNPLMSAAQFAVVCDGENLINGFLGNFPLAAGAPYNPNPGNAPILFTDPTTGTTYNKAFFQLLRRNVEGGPRIADLSHTNYRGVLGVRGDINPAFSYDTYFQYGRTNYTLVYRNEFSVSRLNRALDVVVDPRVGSPTFGQPVCRSVLDQSDVACVPYDVFNINPSAASINYLNVFGVVEGKTSEQIANFNLTGDLSKYGVQTPWAEDGVGINAGVEYRKESLTLNPDQEFQTGDLAGQGAPTLPVNGNFRVLEYFGEIQVPLVQHNFIDELSIGAGYRKSYYKLSNGRSYNTDTYKLSAEFAPIRDVRFRGAYNRAVRAPNIQELFAPQFVGLDGSSDPCSGLPLTLANGAGRFYGCTVGQGMTPGASTPSNPAGQYNGLLGGNANLNPEKATTKTVGVVLQPRFIPRLAVTVDWWNIKLKGAIQGFGADAILNDCVTNATATFTPASCGLINRDAAGSIWLTSGGFVADLPTNVGGINTSGFDFNGSYSHPLGGLGTVSASFIGTLLHKYITDNGLTPAYDCAGLYGPTCSGGSVATTAPLPKWRHKARIGLQTPQGIGVSLQWRRVGKVTAETLSTNPSINGAFNFEPGLHIKAQDYFDLSTNFTFGDHYNFRLGVNNLFDKDPPLVTSGNGGRPGSNLCPAGSCNGNSFPGTWDALGRFLYAGVTLDF